MYACVIVIHACVIVILGIEQIGYNPLSGPCDLRMQGCLGRAAAAGGQPQGGRAARAERGGRRRARGRAARAHR